MNANRHGQGCQVGRGMALFFFCLATRLNAQMIQSYVEPQLLDVHLSAADLSLEANQRKETDKPLPTGPSSTYTQSDLIPTAGLALNGSIYHPNLLSFNLKGRFGYDEEKINSNIATNGGLSSSVQDYDALVRILGEKPYATTLTAGKSTYVQEYDFFNTVHGEATRYGASSGYNAGPVPFTVAANHLETTVDAIPYPLNNINDSLTLSAHNRRDLTNSTDFIYAYNRYSMENAGQSVTDVKDQNIQLIDHESLGRDRPAVLDSRLTYDHLNNSSGFLDEDSSASPVLGAAQTINTLGLQEHLDKPLSPALRSFYDLTADYLSTDGYNGDDYRVQAALVHQLYNSLTSQVDIHSGGGSADADSGQTKNTYYGVGLSENYSKQLGSWGHLNLGFQGVLDHQDNQEPSSGTEFPVFQERHTLSDNTITFLNLSQVDTTTIQVTDLTGLIVYQEGLDYEVIPQGLKTEIQRVVGGTIPNGATVLVSYSALTPPSANGEILTDSYYVRLDLFQNLLELYGRISQVKNYGGLAQNALSAPDSLDEDMGAEMHWLEFSAGAEYEIFESTLTPYRSTRLYQSFSQPLGTFGHFSLNAGESWISFSGTEQYMKTYQLIARYNMQVTRGLECSIEGGKRLEYGYAGDLTYTTVRGEVNWRIGELSVQLTYELEGDTMPAEQLNQERVSLRVKRSF